MKRHCFSAFLIMYVWYNNIIFSDQRLYRQKIAQVWSTTGVSIESVEVTKYQNGRWNSTLADN